jgi:hypothetical protein
MQTLIFLELNFTNNYLQKIIFNFIIYYYACFYIFFITFILSTFLVICLYIPKALYDIFYQILVIIILSFFVFNIYTISSLNSPIVLFYIAICLNIINIFVFSLKKDFSRIITLFTIILTTLILSGLIVLNIEIFSKIILIIPYFEGNELFYKKVFYLLVFLVLSLYNWIFIIRNILGLNLIRVKKNYKIKTT